jgi:hypothetical protein
MQDKAAIDVVHQRYAAKMVVQLAFLDIRKSSDAI